jgi:hypothetical protein
MSAAIHRLTLVAAALLPLTAVAQSYGAYGSINNSGNLLLHNQPREDFNFGDNFGFTDNPQALVPTSLSRVATVSNGGTSTSLFKGSIGNLKAYSSAYFPYGYDAQGHGLFSGYASSITQGSFADKLLVSGAGLAVGTPVSYRMDFSIDGTLSSPSFEIGGFLSTSAGATATLSDMQSGEQVNFNWDASKQATGIYSLVLSTQVGHTLQFVGGLNTTAYVSHYAQIGRNAKADFYNSALYSLTPSVAGLNTVGASGHNFLTPVPEPSTWALLICGLLTGARLQSRRRGQFMGR